MCYNYRCGHFTDYTVKRTDKSMAGTLVIGVVFVDIKGFPLGKYNVRGRNLGNVSFIHGGVSRNVAENVAGCGREVTFASLTEDSALGNDVVRRLSARGVDTSAMRTVESGGIGQWMVILDERGDVAGEISCPPSVDALIALMRERGDELVSECDNIVLEIDCSPELDEIVLALAKEYSKPVYTVVGNMSVILSHREYLAALDCFICNEVEAGQLFGGDLSTYTPDEMLEALSENIASIGSRSMVITMGSKGAVYYDAKRGEGGHTPAIPTKLVDSTGAGDAFLSGTVVGLSSGMPLSDAVKVGTLLASRTIQTAESTAEPDAKILENFEKNPVRY